MVEPAVQARTHASPRRRVICFPYAGGSAAAYRDWQAVLGDDVEVVPVELPGRGKRWHETPVTSMRELLDDLAPRVAPLVRPGTVFFGHSFGALLCFELAHELKRRGRAVPEKFIVSGRQAPHLGEPTATGSLPDPEPIEYLRELKGSPEEVLDNPDLMAMLLPAIRADFMLLDNYRHVPQPQLDAAVDVFYGSTEDIDRQDLEAWSQHFSTPAQLHEFEGDHFFLHDREVEVLNAVQAIAIR